LTYSEQATFSFWHRYHTEQYFDFCYVEVSPDGGSTWERLFDPYSGVSDGWERGEISLDDYVGLPAFTARFRLRTDVQVNSDGWYIDDVMISEPENNNLPPNPPAAFDPPNGGAVFTPSPTLIVANSFDPDGNRSLRYGFRVYTDTLFTELVASADGVSQGYENTEWTVAAQLPDGMYWWRAYAEDERDRSLLARPSAFEIAYGDVAVPDEVVLSRARPNPFAETTDFSFDLPSRSHVEMVVYDMRGRAVRTLIDGERGPGRSSASWDTRDHRGKRVANGQYFVRLSACKSIKHQEIVVLR
jgi:hypothetical protein